MRVIMLWVLIVQGPRPYVLGVYPSHGECAQAKYDFGQVSTNSDQRTKRNTLRCKPRPQRTPVPQP